ncbi:hypothetical protein [Paraburkholderia sp. BCC1886]|uniref:hypothetical protein n=1 Tax=Paraburkholderia sp. BCC1886 TaxID=2562670 RepID=UPI001183012B|nr:hypothetical protein [Paraburkholderia sp. BCC1886]
MDKRTYFLKALGADEYRRRAWIISAFSLIREAPEAYKTHPYPWRIVQTPSGHFFLNPEDGNALTLIEDADPALPPLSRADRITLKAGEVPNLFEDVETNYGNVLFNYVALIYPFGNRVAFKTGRIAAGKLEEEILKRAISDLKPGQEPLGGSPDTQPIYMHEYVKFADAMFALGGFTQLWVPAVTRKTMVAPPGLIELRNKLLEENKERLSDPAVIANISKQLIAFDKEYMKGDEGEGFLITKKAYDVVRSKLFLMHGAEAGMGDSTTNVDLIKNSLSEGWDLSKFPAMNNSLRAGSFNRGAETMLGGELVKWLLRAASNAVVATEDCGTRLGDLQFVDKTNIHKLPGFSIVTPEGHQPIANIEEAGAYLGKTVLRRSPMFCQLPKGDYCSVCVGSRLAMSPTALGAAIAEYGSTFMLLFMKAMHGKSLEVAKMDYQTALF